jgi:hypothetical protein
MSFRLASICVVFALAAGAVASTASATRRPSAGEWQAIRATSEVWLKQNLEPAFLKNTGILRIVISTANHQYARVDILIKRVGYDAMLLRATSKGWKVLDFGSGGFGCNLAPRAVMKDLFGGCVS